MDNQIINSDVLSQLMYTPATDEPDSKSVYESCDSGLFIGNSYIYSVPALLDFKKLINPHILTIGMTGSGKTFLMKNLILRLSILDGSKIILIDFTGEYKGHLNLTNTPVSSTNPDAYGENEITYFNLASLPEGEKISISSEILRNSLLLMRKQVIDTGKRLFIVLDEAWKLLRSEKSLETIIREGRKYGVGLILSSQLIEDADNPIISNIATLFLFRTQNRKSLEKIAKNYNIPDQYIQRVQNLDLGSCLAMQLYKSNHRSAFIIRKVAGLNFKKMLRIELVDNMGIEISSTELEKLLKKLCGYKYEEAMKPIKERGSIPLNEIIREVLARGADRKETLREFKKLGFDDAILSDSFSYALYELSDSHETE